MTQRLRKRLRFRTQLVRYLPRDNFAAQRVIDGFMLDLFEQELSKREAELLRLIRSNQAIPQARKKECEALDEKLDEYILGKPNKWVGESS